MWLEGKTGNGLAKDEESQMAAELVMQEVRKIKSASQRGHWGSNESGRTNKWVQKLTRLDGEG